MLTKVKPSAGRYKSVFWKHWYDCILKGYLKGYLRIFMYSYSFSLLLLIVLLCKLDSGVCNKICQKDKILLQLWLTFHSFIYSRNLTEIDSVSITVNIYFLLSSFLFFLLFEEMGLSPPYLFSLPFCRRECLSAPERSVHTYVFRRVMVLPGMLFYTEMNSSSDVRIPQMIKAVQLLQNQKTTATIQSSAVGLLLGRELNCFAWETTTITCSHDPSVAPSTI